MSVLDSLPEAWIGVRGGDYVTNEKNDIVDGPFGSNLKSSEYVDSGIPIARLQNVKRFNFIDKNIRFVTNEKADFLQRHSFKSGDILISKLGDPLGLACIVPESFTRGVIVADLVRLRHDSQITSAKFLTYLLNSEVVIKQIAGHVKGTTRPRINLSVVRGLELPFPPLAEQKVIADKLDELLAQVESTKARLDAIPTILKSFRQSVLAAAVSGKLTEEWRGENDFLKAASISEIEELWISRYKALGKKFKSPKVTPIQDELMNLPSSWLWTQIGLVCDVYVGATPSRKNEAYWNGKINWVSSSEVAFCRINETKESITDVGLKCTSTNIHPIGTVMLAMIGQGKTRGQPAILDIEACHNQNTAAIRVLDSHCLSEYLYYFLYERYEETRRVGSGNNQQAMNKTVVQSLAFPLPPIEEQTEIVRRVEELFAFADKVEAQVNEAQARVNNLTQSILAKAFRGELTANWRAANPELICGENSASALLERIKTEREALVLAAKSTKKKPAKKASLKKVTAKKTQDTTINRSLSLVESVIADGVAHKPQDIFDKLTPDLSMTQVFNEISKLLSDNKIEEKTVDGITGFFIK
ncbi:restriction endonuclease subunit S [Shewanella donghaensis]|uniref:restriction endonuclease subunit S n=1 Tax=Shewanella donghaensis TaxID=238836 RepID=UPI00118372BA|nr:restriction endonuclease subunit S [Shewanella donghaensis]